MEMQHLNFTLEVVNGSISILSFFLLFFLGIYLIYDIRREGFSVKIFFLMSTAVSLVVALFVEKLGTLTTRTVVWAWRAQGGAVPFTKVEDFFLILGAVFSATGIVMMVRVLSRPRFGDWPWMTASVVMLSYATVEMIINLMR
jgi:hypothetical protein